MRHTLIFFIIILLIVIFCGCCFDLGTGKVVRSYTHETSKNVSFIIYKEHWQNLAVLKSYTNDINIVVSFNMQNATSEGSSKFIRDYVRFFSNETNLTVYINLMSYMDSFQTRNANARIEISIPENTSYTIDYVDAYYKFPN